MTQTRAIIAMVHKIIQPLKTKLSMVAARIVIDAVQDSPQLQTATVEALFGEVFDGVEHMQPGGLSHTALQGAEGLMICVGGSRELPVAVGISNRSVRPLNGSAGETILYAAELLGVQARIAPGGVLEVVGGGGVLPADDFVAMAGKIHTEISNMLQAGVGAGGAGATNFTAAKAAWDLIFVPPLTGVASSTLKADD